MHTCVTYIPADSLRLGYPLCTPVWLTSLQTHWDSVTHCTHLCGLHPCRLTETGLPAVHTCVAYIPPELLRLGYPLYTPVWLTSLQTHWDSVTHCAHLCGLHPCRLIETELPTVHTCVAYIPADSLRLGYPLCTPVWLTSLQTHWDWVTHCAHLCGLHPCRLTETRLPTVHTCLAYIPADSLRLGYPLCTPVWLTSPQTYWDSVTHCAHLSGLHPCRLTETRLPAVHTCVAYIPADSLRLGYPLCTPVWLTSPQTYWDSVTHCAHLSGLHPCRLTETGLPTVHTCVAYIPADSLRLGYPLYTPVWLTSLQTYWDWVTHCAHLWGLHPCRITETRLPTVHTCVAYIPTDLLRLGYPLCTPVWLTSLQTH